MKSLTSYDEQLTTKLNHLKIHSGYLPHIGVDYEQSRTKTFIIAESHYVHKAHNNKFSVMDWYSNPSSIYITLDGRHENDRNWFYTRGVVKHYQTSKKQPKGFGLFGNLEKAYKSIFKDINLFDECVFLNYFQRPAEVEGDSIKVHQIDSEVALENLMGLNEVLKPDKIIFVSSKAYNDFLNTVSKEQKENLPYVGSVPHPSASSWWNRKSTKYGLNGEAVTGKEKFQRIMRPKDKEV